MTTHAPHHPSGRGGSETRPRGDGTHTAPSHPFKSPRARGIQANLSPTTKSSLHHPRKVPPGLGGWRGARSTPPFAPGEGEGEG